MSGRASAETAPEVKSLQVGEGCSRVSNICIYYNICERLTTGTSWAVVDSPSPDLGATHVSVGVNVVWALTKDNKVRKQ